MSGSALDAGDTSGLPFTSPHDLSKQSMTEALETGNLIGTGRVADVVGYGDNVVKLYREGRGKREAFREAAILSILEDADLLIPSVRAVQKFGHRWGLEMSRAPDSTIPSNDERLAGWMAGLHWRVHQIRGKELASLKQKLMRNIQSATQLDILDKDKLLLQLEDLPDDDCLCHGDFHPGNIMGTGTEPYVVDWLDATTGSPQADACRTYLLAMHHAPALAGAYLTAYSTLSGYPAQQILLWLPIIAAARLSENVPDEVPRLLALAKSNI